MSEVKADQAGVSKRSLKKIEKTKKWEAKKLYQRQKQKEKPSKRTRSSIEHITRFNLTKEDEDSGKLSKQDKQKMFFDLVQKGPRIIIDCDFNDLMTEKEIKSVCQQFAYCTNVNKQANPPINLIFSGVKGPLRQQLTKQSF